MSANSFLAFFGVACLAATLVACGKIETSAEPSDGEATLDSGRDATDAPSYDTRDVTNVPEERPPVPPEPTPIDGTTGATCKSDADCDKTGLKIEHCSSTFFVDGSRLPQPVCVGLDNDDCGSNDGTTLVPCDNDQGICVASGTHQLCLPACTFDDSGAAPKGCGTNACSFVGFGTDAVGRIGGAGVCVGNCTSDDECRTVAGERCQVETGLCVNTAHWSAYAKKPGEACHPPTKTGDPAECNCLDGGGSAGGYCTRFCTVGGAPSCDPGFTCTASLPKVDWVDPTKKAFSENPAGIAGFCLADCIADADCAPLNAYCNTNVVGLAAGKGVCQVGKRP